MSSLKKKKKNSFIAFFDLDSLILNMSFLNLGKNVLYKNASNFFLLYNISKMSHSGTLNLKWSVLSFQTYSP